VSRESGLLRNPASGPVLPCGAVIRLTPKAEGDGFRVSGIATLRRATSGKDRSESASFESQEAIVDAKFLAGKTKTINLSGGGKIEIIVTPSE